jgi:hypothetical protein
MKKSDYEALGGHMEHVISINDVLAGKVGHQNDHQLSGKRIVDQQSENPWPIQS